MRLLKEIRNLTGSYHVKSGTYHYYRNEFKQAIDFLRKALKEGDNLTAADRRSARYYLTLAFMDWSDKLQADADLDGAAKQLRRAAEVSPRYPDLHFALGRLLEQLGRDTEAIDEYEKAIACHEGFVEARTALAFCQLRSGLHDEAATTFGQALDGKRERMEKPFRRATELLSQGKTAEASEFFRDALMASPMLCDEYLRKAKACLKDEQYENALAEFDRALLHKPKYPDLHNFRGVVLCELERLDEAIEAFRQSAALSPRFVVPRLNLAFALIRAGEYKLAETELESILELDPTEPAATAQLEELRSGRLPERRRPVARGTSR